jgi:hypothetical protein
MKKNEMKKGGQEEEDDYDKQDIIPSHMHPTWCKAFANWILGDLLTLSASNTPL